MDLECCQSAEEVLLKVQSFGVGIESISKALENDLLTANLMATSDGKNLLQMAALARNVSVLPAVVQAYIKVGLLTEALESRDGGPLPLHLAVTLPNYENSVLLLKLCKEHSPSSLTAITEYGATLLHLAVSQTEGVSIVKHLLREYKDICEPMLLTKNNRGSTPLQMASAIKFSAEHELACVETFAKTLAAKTNHPQSMQSRIIDQQTERPKRRLEHAREVMSLLNEPTMMARAVEAERKSMLREKQKLEEKEKVLTEELQAHLQDKNWEVIVSDYLLSHVRATQKFSVGFLAVEVGELQTSTSLPPLSPKLLNVFKHYIGMKEDDPIVKSSLLLLNQFSKPKDSTAVILNDMGITPLILKYLCCLQTELQQIAVSILYHIVSNLEDKNLLHVLKQPLLLAKYFSTEEKVKKIATDVLEMLGASLEAPDPGSWSTSDVCFWMKSHNVLERRSEFIKTFKNADINGLHLLELSSTEMTGLGVKFVSDQRTLSSLIDDLRRLNMRTVVGRKDVFLSYAHINVEFAIRVKKALNNGGYSVWIDTAGIRAGQKWRTEIAHCIHDCRLIIFVMTPRSTNSQYCHDELALAEEYKKPIITVKFESTKEMDPGLKLLVQRRQWMDFSDETEFDMNCFKLLEAVNALIGPGKGTYSDEQENKSQQRHSVKLSGSIDKEVTTAKQLTDDIKEMVASEVEKATTELRQRIQVLETQIKDIMSQLTIASQH